jgi:pimeloyl-ACP methyl ester carboxylesterase
MPFADRGPVRMYYESRGRGPAVLLVMGLGMTLSAWWRTVPVLAGSFRVIAFDNRGVGRSAASSLPYTVAQMADDAMAVLDAAGEDAAHVYGISLGGMVAQEVALRHPDRVRALVLGATTPGGMRAVAPREAALSFFARAVSMGAEETAWASVPFLYSERTRRRHADRIAADIARRVRFPVDGRAYGQQVAAAVAHSASARLEQIAAPTLVVHGEEDELVPAANGRILAGAIPGAELRLLPHSGHLYATDEPRADRDIARFLRGHSPRRPRDGDATAPPRGRASRRRWRLSRGRRRAARLLRILRLGRFPIARYDRLTVGQILPRLDPLSESQLRRIAERERAGRARKTVLAAIARRLD